MGGDGPCRLAELVERELLAGFHIPDRFMDYEAAVPLGKRPQRQALPNMNLMSRFAACDATEGLNLWVEVEATNNTVVAEPLLEEVTYRLREDVPRIQQHNDKEIDVSSVETWESMNFNRRKAAMQRMNGLTEREANAVGADGISTRGSDFLDRCSGPIAASTVIRAISPPPHAPTPVAISDNVNRKVLTQAQVDLPDVS